MKFVVIAVAFLSAVSADVSHLSNLYSTPVHSSSAQTQHHISYNQNNREILQAPVQEVVDNSVVENVSSEEQKLFVARPNIHTAVHNNVQTSDVLAHQAKVANLARQLLGHVQQAAAVTVPAAEIHVESNHFGAEPYGNIHTAVGGQHVQKAASLAHQVPAHVQQAVGYAQGADEAVAHDTETQHVNDQFEEEHLSGVVNGQLHTTSGLAHHVQNTAALAHRVKAVAVGHEDYAAPSSQGHQPNQNQAFSYTHVKQQKKTQEHKPYYTAAVVQQHGGISADATVPQQVHQQHHYAAQHAVPLEKQNVAATAPAVQDYSQTRYYAQQSHAVYTKAPAAIETQYAGNGGYVY